MVETTGRVRSRRRILLAAIVGVTALLVTGLSVGGAAADTNTGPNTSDVAVNGTTVTATVVPSTGGLTVIAAEYFLDTVGADGTGTTMTVSGTTATGSLPTLAIGSTHTVYVHGEDNASGPTSGVWGPTASTTFTVGTTRVTIDIGSLSVTLGTDGTYTSVLQPSDPYQPGDPYKLFASVKTKSVTATLGFTRYTLAVSAGRIDFDTQVLPPNPIHPGDPYRVLVTTLVATNGIKYKASIDGFTTRFVPPNPI